MPTLNVVIDISHHNGGAIDFAKAKAGGILGVIHKASQGQSNVDPLYAKNRTKARAAGLLWGAYHFATGSDGIKQAQHFLKTVGTDEEALLVLDFEPNPSGPSMSLEEARAFNTHVFTQTGKWPGIYPSIPTKIRKAVHAGSGGKAVSQECFSWISHRKERCLFNPVTVASTLARTSRRHVSCILTMTKSFSSQNSTRKERQ